LVPFYFDSRRSAEIFDSSQYPQKKEFFKFLKSIAYKCLFNMQQLHAYCKLYRLIKTKKKTLDFLKENSRKTTVHLIKINDKNV